MSKLKHMLFSSYQPAVIPQFLVHVFYLPPGHSRDVPWWEIMMWCLTAYGQSTYQTPRNKSFLKPLFPGRVRLGGAGWPAINCPFFEEVGAQSLQLDPRNHSNHSNLWRAQWTLEGLDDETMAFRIAMCDLKGY